jgi:hypothetical protein
MERGSLPGNALLDFVQDLHNDSEVPITVPAETIARLHQLAADSPLRTVFWTPHRAHFTARVLDCVLPVSAEQRRQISELQDEKNAAIDGRQFERAAELRNEQIALREKLAALHGSPCRLEFDQLMTVIRQLVSDGRVDL